MVNDQQIKQNQSREKLKSTLDKVVGARLINVESGRKVELKQRDGSYCYFVPDDERESFGCYELRFRLDLKDLDEEGSPTLDADPFDSNGKQVKAETVLWKEILGKEAHHTIRKFDEGKGLYTYKFQKGSFTIDFLVETTNRLCQRGNARIANNTKQEEGG